MGIGSMFGRNAAVRLEVERSRGTLYRVAEAWCQDPLLADDLTQEAIEKALQHAGQLRDPARLRGWLFRILKNCLRDHLRARRDTVTLESIEATVPAEHPTPEQARASAQIVTRVRHAVARLPLGQRQVLTLVDLEGLTYAEVGEALEIPIGTVMSRLSRARVALREELRPMAVDTLGTRLQSVK